MARVDVRGLPEIVEPWSVSLGSSAVCRDFVFVAFKAFVALTDCRRGMILPLP
jgi:hypothetical protein